MPVSQLVVFEGVNERIDYEPEKAEEQAAALLDLAIGNFKERRASVQPVTGLPMKEAVAGFSTESILDALGGTLDPLLNVIKDGTIRGVVGLVSCTSLRDSGQDAHSVAVAKELIKRDLLVLSMGCGNAAMQVAGLCSPEAKALAGNGLKAVCEKLGRAARAELWHLHGYGPGGRPYRSGFGCPWRRSHSRPAGRGLRA